MFKDMCTETATMFNYIGEVNGTATYIKTLLKNVKAERKFSRKETGTGFMPANEGKVYFFDSFSEAEDLDGNGKTYLPPDEFKNAEDKDNYFTFSEFGKDYIVFGVSNADKPNQEPKAMKIEGCNHLMSGSQRMHHWRIDII